MTLADTAREHYATQTVLAERAQRTALGLWGQLDPDGLTESWTEQRIGERLFVEVSTAQLAAAVVAEGYVAAALRDQGAPVETVGALSPRAFAGIASDGRDLEQLLYQPVITAKVAIGAGAQPAGALQQAGYALATIVGTQVSDLSRAAVSVGMVARPAVTGWARMLVPPSCGRCAVLAGRVYRADADFNRHPNCDCTQVPAVEDGASDLRTDPRGYFDSLEPADQDRYFTKAGAQAIRDGADIGQVVNARRGANGLSSPGRLTAAEQQVLRGGRERGRLQRVDVYGRQVLVTSEGGTRRGLAGQLLERRGGAQRAAGERYARARVPRLMPESIYELADGDRAEAQRLLRLYGYIT